MTYHAILRDEEYLPEFTECVKQRIGAVVGEDEKQDDWTDFGLDMMKMTELKDFDNSRLLANFEKEFREKWGSQE